MVASISSKYKQNFSQKLLKNIEIYNYWSSYQLTKSAQKDMLKLFNRICTNSPIMLSIYKFGELHFYCFPYRPNNGIFTRPDRVDRRTFCEYPDHVQYRSHINYRYYNKSNYPIISRVHADLMTSEWCRKTEVVIIKKSAVGNILLLRFNSDGAQLGAYITSNFSDHLIYQDMSKCVIGYLAI